MRHARRLRLAQTGLLASCMLAAGCAWAPGATRYPARGADGRPQPLVALPGGSPAAGERALTVRLRVGEPGGRALQVIRYPGDTRLRLDDVIHVVVTLYEGDTETAVDTLDLAKSRLEDPISFGRLKGNTSYWIGAVAYRAPGTAAADALSTTDNIGFVRVDVADDDAPEPVELQVRLFDRPQRLITTWAGLNNTTLADGQGTVARFSGPRGGDVEADGSYLVADSNHAAIRRISPAGLVSTPSAGYGTPYDVVSLGGGTYVLAERDGQRLTYFDGSTSLAFAGVSNAPGYREGDGHDLSPATGPQFSNPSGLDADATYIYVADTNNHVIRKVHRTTRVTSLVAGTPQATGAADGPAASASFASPADVAVGPDGALYVADLGNNKVRKIKDGRVTTLAGTGAPGDRDGDGTEAEFSAPASLVVDPQGFVFVADTDNDTIRRIAPDGTTRTWVGEAGTTGSDDGGPADARFHAPAGLGLGPDGTLYVSDTSNGRIRRIQ